MIGGASQISSELGYSGRLLTMYVISDRNVRHCSNKKKNQKKNSKILRIEGYTIDFKIRKDNFVNKGTFLQEQPTAKQATDRSWIQLIPRKNHTVFQNNRLPESERLTVLENISIYTFGKSAAT